MVKAVDRNRIAVLLVLIRLNSGHPFEIFVYMYVSVCILVKWLVSHSMLQGFGAESRSKVEVHVNTQGCVASAHCTGFGSWKWQSSNSNYCTLKLVMVSLCVNVLT